MAQTRTLVVYYSRTGTTRKVAQTIASALGADLEEIRETISRRGVFGYLRAAYEAARQRSAPIHTGSKNPHNYDLVVIGTPVWAGAVAPPVRTYIAAAKERLSSVAFFCTLGGHGAETTFKQMEALAGKAPLARCAVTASDVTRGLSGLLAADFVKSLTTPRASVKPAMRIFPEPAHA